VTINSVFCPLQNVAGKNAQIKKFIARFKRVLAKVTIEKFFWQWIDGSIEKLKSFLGNGLIGL